MNQRISTFFYSMDGIGGKDVWLDSLDTLLLEEDSIEYKHFLQMLEEADLEPSDESVKQILEFAQQAGNFE